MNHQFQFIRRGQTPDRKVVPPVHQWVRWIALSAMLLLSGCSLTPLEPSDGAPDRPLDWRQVKPITPKNEPLSPYGNPASYEVNGHTYRVLDSAVGYKEQGMASWYGTKFHGRRTSSGEPYDMMQLSAAHKTLPLPSYVRVTNLENGRSVVVRVNDRGPFARGRIIDLSWAAAHKLEMTEKGVARVEVEAIVPGGSARVSQANRLGDVRPNDVGRFRFVQVGAYGNYERAQKLAKVLDREIKLPVTITSVRRGGKKLYRVRIGPVPDLDTAKKLVDALNIKELGQPAIIYED